MGEKIIYEQAKPELELPEEFISKMKVGKNYEVSGSWNGETMTWVAEESD